MSLKYTAYRAVTAAMPSSVAGVMDWYFMPTRPSFGGPFNRQQRRVEMVRELLHSISFAAIVETGTHVGTTTAALRQWSNLPVYSVEILPRFHHFARMRFRHDDGVHLFRDDSRPVLERFARQPDFPHDCVLFYLDAHWQEPPLASEVAIIGRAWRNPVIIIDDFRVDDDPGYAFDQYGPGNELSIRYLGPLSDMRMFWPRAASSEETGKRRGSIVLARGAVSDAVARCRTLREVTAAG